MCGFRGFKRNKGTGFFVDKYIGRKVKGPDLPNQLAKFFSNGETLRINVITEMIEKLQSMKETVETHTEGIRFKGSSILVTYCADAADFEGEGTLTNIKLVDF